jgi:hypothetical protein
MNLKPLEQEIRIARKALAEAQRIEVDNGYDDAILSMERTHCEGWLEALEYAYILMNGAAYNDEDND